MLTAYLVGGLDRLRMRHLRGAESNSPLVGDHFHRRVDADISSIDDQVIEVRVAYLAMEVRLCEVPPLPIRVTDVAICLANRALASLADVLNFAFRVARQCRLPRFSLWARETAHPDQPTRYWRVALT